MSTRFNTASGKYCCNPDKILDLCIEAAKVSIPQAVSTVATPAERKKFVNSIIKFQYRKR